MNTLLIRKNGVNVDGSITAHSTIYLFCRHGVKTSKRSFVLPGKGIIYDGLNTISPCHC